jgi:hypothetical protein
MKTKAILKAAEKFIIDNSPGILTGLGVTGAVTTAVLTGKASWNSAVLISDTEAERGVKESNFVALTSKEKFEIVWKEFIPPAAVGVVTVAAIIAANSVGTRRTAAITAAFKLSEQVNQDYKKKVLETLGLQKEEKLRSEIAAEKIAQNPPPGNMLIISGSNVLFFDELTGRYFENTMEKVQQAVNEINYQVNQYNHASLSDFYWKIGLQATSFSDNVGWCLDELLDVQYSPVMYEGKPAIMIGYNNEPIKGYDRLQ